MKLKAQQPAAKISASPEFSSLSQLRDSKNEFAKTQNAIMRLKPEFEKTTVFIVIFLENCKNFEIFTKSSNEFGEFLNFL